MKNLFEKIAYTLFGALLVSVTHFVGSIDTQADAQLTTFDEAVITGTLTVKGAIIVGDASASHGNLVHIKADEKNAFVLLLHNQNEYHFDSSVMLSAGSTKGTPIADIKLLDKFGNTATGSSNLGWSKVQ